MRIRRTMKTKNKKLTRKRLELRNMEVKRESMEVAIRGEMTETGEITGREGIGKKEMKKAVKKVVTRREVTTKRMKKRQVLEIRIKKIL